MEGSDDKRDFKCVERGVFWLRLDGLDTTHLNMNSRNCEIHSEAIKGTQLRSHSKSFILNSTSRKARFNCSGQNSLLCSAGQVLAWVDYLWIKTKS